MTKVSRKPIKILTITPGLNLCGGIERYVVNYYSHIKNEVNMDFITHDIKEDYYKKIIEKDGNKVFLFPKIGIRNVFKLYKLVDDFFEKHNDYDIVHCHMANAAFLYFWAAKKHGIKVRILHSHQNKYADKLTHVIRNIPLIKKGLKLSTDFFACSKIAGDFLFKDRKYYIINNAIDAKKFAFNQKVRLKIRKELKLDDYFVIGNVGRFCVQKNQKFLLDVFSKIREKGKSKLLLIGDGELKDELKQYAKKINVDNDVIFISSTSEVEKYYCAMDAFALPSLYEGLGIVNIEAQCSGLKTFVSTAVPVEAKISDLITYIDLNSSQEWANIISSNMVYNRESHINDAVTNGYDINKESYNVLNIYKELIESRK